MTQCAWVNPASRENAEYHDTEWGVPVHDDIRLFEMLILEGAQAGLSWETILKKRENYRAAFKGFDPAKVARFTEKDCERLMANEGIVRNRLKIASAVKNARAFLAIQKEFGSFDRFLWNFAGGTPVTPRYASIKEIPVRDELSDRISKDLKKRGMSFVGSTIIMAYLQAVGVINAHTVDCFRHDEVLRHA
ncbi:MAG TPA: DNA-3-methyladenine glycosylase I [Spirochaetota bacterium]|nr:DNA-3-methyladenine glycosylase I [Spirochaetota bacterium]